MNEDPAPITKDWMRETCLIGQGSKCCKYIGMGLAGWTCIKNTRFAEIVETRSGMVAQGDNCSGPPSFIPSSEKPAERG